MLNNFFYSLSKINSICKGEILVGDKDKLFDIRNIFIDSRKIENLSSKNVNFYQSIFLAIKGKRLDGHFYLQEVLEKKIGLLIVHQKINLFIPQHTSVLYVEDTTKAYGKIAADYLKKWSGEKIAITGSSGKTTCRILLHQILAQKYRVYSTDQNFNNHIGLPMTIFGIRKKYDFYLFEIGMNHLGEIDYLSQIVQPDVAIITSIDPAHIGHFTDISEIAEAKYEILNHLKKEFWYPANISYQGKIDKKQKDFKKIKVTNQWKIKSFFDGEQLFNHYQFKNYSFKKKFNTAHSINLTLCSSFASSRGVGEQQIIDAFSNDIQNERRLELIPKMTKNKHQIAFIDDAYNANPESMKTNIEWFSILETSSGWKKIMILGDMFELGKFSKKYHLEIIEKLVELNKKRSSIATILVGENFTQYTPGDYLYKAKSIDKIDPVFEKVIKNDRKILVFCKASHGMNFNQWIKGMNGSEN